ncbi:MAG: class I SAM-dependent methyltransferase [Candidatus Ozemobacteraceae bacterium]
MESFGVGDLIYQGEIYDKMNSFSFDLDFYKKWCTHIGGSVLEMCCGTGRLTVPLKKGGLDITGLDMSDSMLQAARIKAEKEKLEIPFVKGDIRKFNLKKKFSTVFIPFNSLQNTYSIQEIESVLEEVKNHLEPNGQFIFDIFNPSIHLMVEREKNDIEAFRFKLDDGNEVVVKERCEYDSASQVNRVKWIFKIGDSERVEKLDMRCFFPLEMDAILKYNGLVVNHKFGSFDEAPFNSKSAKQIYVCQSK